jgi:hypothetical protein
MALIDDREYLLKSLRKARELRAISFVKMGSGLEPLLRDQIFQEGYSKAAASLSWLVVACFADSQENPSFCAEFASVQYCVL